MIMAAENIENKIPDAAKPIQDKALQIVPRATELKVVDEQSKELGSLLYNQINQALEQIGDVFNPMIEAAMEAKRKTEAARKAIVTQKERFEDPWNEAKIYVVRQLTAYKEVQDRRREEEERRLRDEAMKAEAERRRLAEEEAAKRAAELEAAGAKEEAQAVMEEAIAEAEEPIQVYVPPPPTPKTEINGGSFRVTWSAKVVNLKALCLAIGTGKAAINLVEPNIPALNKMAIALHENMIIPGVEAVKETGMAKSRR